jgi:aldose 1-epimerase
MAGDANPLHGDGWLGPWLVESQADDRACLFFVHEAGEWPWAYEARQTFRLSAAGLVAEIACKNLSGEPMPCGLGFHPYFPCDGETRIDTEVDKVWEVDAQVLPTGISTPSGRYALDDQPACARGLDNGYGGWGGDMQLTYGDGSVTRMTSPDAHFFQIYSPMQGGLLAAEPVSHANAALNEPEERWAELGLRVLEPGREMRLRMVLSHSG